MGPQGYTLHWLQAGSSIRVIADGQSVLVKPQTARTQMDADAASTASVSPGSEAQTTGETDTSTPGSTRAGQGRQLAASIGRSQQDPYTAASTDQ